MQTRQSEAYDVVIIGGGMVGATLACGLANARLRVALLERNAPPPPPTGEYGLRVSALSLGSAAILQRLGAWARLNAERVCAVEQMHVWDASGTGRIDFDAAAIGEPCLAYIVENDALSASLWEVVKASGCVRSYCPATISSIEFGDPYVLVGLDEGTVLRTRLVVGADGANSVVRTQFGIGVRRLDYGQQAIVANVRTERPHAASAWQRFLPTGPVAFLPLANGCCSIVWSVDTALARRLAMLNDEAFMEALGEALDGRLGRVCATSERRMFALERLHAQRYVAPRVALIGDAAHAVHPLAGQGVNLGVLDADVLAEELCAAAATQRDPGGMSLLRRYERARKGDNLAMLFLTDTLQRLFASRLPAVRRLRNAGLALTDVLAPMKTALMRHATGRVTRGDGAGEPRAELRRRSPRAD
jgi:2-polyprenylphenol 6-hydroxylase